MTFDKFLTVVKKRVETELSDAEVRIRHFPKLQGGSYVGISVQPNGAAAAAMFNVGVFFEAFRTDASLRSAILDRIVSDVRRGIAMIPGFDPEPVTDYEAVKNRLALQVIPIGPNADMLATIPHKTIGDIAAVYRVESSDGAGGTVSALITDQILEDYGVTADQLHEDTVKSHLLRHPPVLKSMSEMMGDLTEGAAEVPESPMWVATVEGGLHGAAVLGLPGFLERSAEKLGGDFFVLPCSVHEVIFLRDDGTYDREQLETMVRSVNAAEVDTADFLSDSVYHYDSALRILERSVSFENRCGKRVS